MPLLLDAIHAKLTADGVLNGSTWKGFIGFTPDDQDQEISLVSTGGFPQDTHGGETVSETFQVVVRAAAFEHTVGRNKWQDMFNSLHDADLSADNIHLIQALASGPVQFSDDKKRPNFSANFRVIRDTP